MTSLNQVFERIRKNLKSRAFIFHVGIVLVAAAVFGVLVFNFWFVYPYFLIAGGASLFLLLLLVDFICGPLCTLVVYDSKKSLREIVFDFFVIGFIQLFALAYGAYSIALARPIALVFEVDRFHLITNADIDPREMQHVPVWGSPLSLSSIQFLGIRSPKSESERSLLFDLAIQGIEPGQKPSWWQSYDKSRSQVIKSAGTMAELLKENPQHFLAINQEAIKASKNLMLGETENPQDLRWIPIVGRKTANWVALIDPKTARIRGFVSL